MLGQTNSPKRELKAVFKISDTINGVYTYAGNTEMPLVLISNDSAGIITLASGRIHFNRACKINFYCTVTLNGNSTSRSWIYLRNGSDRIYTSILTGSWETHSFNYVMNVNTSSALNLLNGELGVLSYTGLRLSGSETDLVESLSLIVVTILE